MAVVNEILDALESKVNALFPTYVKAKFAYQIEKNNRKTSEKIYTIKPLSGSSTEGVTLSATFSQDFEVLFSDIYQPKNGNDDNITDKIIVLNGMIQDLNKEVFQKRLDLTSAKVLLVQLVGISEPLVDLENNTIAMSATFTINYRFQL